MARESMLWPPSHKLINVGLSASAQDACSGAVSVSVAVFSNESDSQGDAGFTPDAVGGIGSLRLRAERDGQGNGRVYLIAVSANDPSGNSAIGCLSVVVPHDRSASSVQSVQAQAAAARAFCADHQGAPPPGYTAVGS